MKASCGLYKTGWGGCLIGPASVIHSDRPRLMRPWSRHLQMAWPDVRGMRNMAGKPYSRGTLQNLGPKSSDAADQPAADPQQLGLSAQCQPVCAVDHRFAFSKPALPSAADKNRSPASARRSSHAASSVPRRGPIGESRAYPPYSFQDVTSLYLVSTQGS